MPTFDSTEYAAWKAEPASVPNVNTWHGRVRTRYAVSPGATGLAQNDFVRMFPIYTGERPLFFQVISEANTALLTMDLGLEGGDEDKYLAAVAINATPIDSILPSLSKVPETADGVVAIKFEAANPSDTADVTVIMYYVRD